MMRFLFLIIFASLSLQANAWTWDDLWATADQQAQKLMNKGQYAKAKDKFERDDWRAAAAYKAGDYQLALDLYQQDHSERGFYNTGNALARLARYEEALAAYKKALALNPNNQDAQFNYKLVSELLKQDKEQQQQNKDQQNKDQQNKDQQNKDQQNKDQQNKDQQNKDQQNKDQQNKDQQNKDQQNKDQQDKDQQNKDQQNKDQQDKDQQNKDQQNKDQQNKDQQNKDQQNKDQQNKDEQNKDEQNKDEQNKKKQQADEQTKEDKEQQQANEQWLRLIPDDPGGLLREKFLRDHLRRQRGWYQ